MPRDACARIQAFTPTETESLGQRTYARIRDAIVDGSLPGDSRVSERSLALSLGISAQPVREALRRLEADGMVVTLPRRGTVVAVFTPERIEEFGLMRIALEGAAAALAARRAVPADIDALRTQLRVMHPTRHVGDLTALAQANARFHDMVHAIAGNPILIRSLTALRAHEYIGRVHALQSSPYEPAMALREHAGVVAALRRRDPKLAEARMRAHVERSLMASGLVRSFGAPAPGG
ncbi:MAG: GntR family transcriptional regulator [Janthinobacterium lividum]